MSVGSLVASGPLILAIPVAAAAGAVTFLSPCCLPLVPGYLSYLTGLSGSAATAVQPVPPAAGSAVALTPAVAVAGAAVAGPTVVGPTAAVPTVPTRSRVILGTLLFVLGFSALFAVEGVTVASLGDTLRLHAVGLQQI